MRRILLLLMGMSLGLALSVYTGAVEQRTLAQAPAETEAAAAVFPAPVPGTSLTVLGKGYYEGPFLEAETEEHVFDIAALIVRNDGEARLDGEIRLLCGGEEYRFAFTGLGAGETVMALETQARHWGDGALTELTGSASPEERQALGPEEVLLEEAGDITLRLTNLTDRTLEDLELWFKSYDSGSGIYIGGIAYRLPLEPIAPGESIEVSPYRYVQGYSRVIGVFPGA